MKTMGGSYHNLAALAEAKFNDARTATVGRSPLGMGQGVQSSSGLSLDSASGRGSRLIIVSNQLPIRAKRGVAGWDLEWDDDALVAQAKEGIPDEFDVVYVGMLPVEVDVMEQEEVCVQLKNMYGCAPVFLPAELKEKYYKGFCKQQLWPLFHYVLPMSPTSTGRFDAELWQAYVKANKVFMEKVVEEVATDADTIWIHDYHLLVLPSLLRKRFNKIRAGVFLHCPFPSSEIFRTFPKREELLRSLLNADVIGFHTFDYARHFLSCCSRMLGLEHETSRGSITIEYYGRSVGLKIMPTGVNPQRLLSGFEWPEFRWRRGELLSQFKDRTVLLGVDDMDVFKGIELKLQAYERLLTEHPEWVGSLVLVQITNAPRSSSRELTELHGFVRNLVADINTRFGLPEEGYEPVHYLERHVPLHERIAFYTIADVAVVTATRDGMNLVPYEYVVCRHGPFTSADGEAPRESMLVVSEFVGCSPSLSGALRVNPWSIDSVADGLYTALKASPEQRRLRHDKHWRYVSQHTVAYWASSYLADLARFTKNHVTMKCYGLGLGLDTFRMVALDANFRKLEAAPVLAAYKGCNRRLFLLDYDGTLIPHSSISGAPPSELQDVLRALASAPGNDVWIISGRARTELSAWFDGLPELGLAAEHGFYCRPPSASSWQVLQPAADFSWQSLALPILKQYQESTDGSFIEVKESALVWHYRDADHDFGNWQAKELLDHLEDVLSNKPIEVVSGNTIVEVKPQGVSKGGVVERIMAGASLCPAQPPRQPGGAGHSHGPLQAGPAHTHAPTHPGGHAPLAEAAAGAADSDAASSRLLPPLPPVASGAAAASATGPGLGARPPLGYDFILAIGDDRSDEDMFVAIEHYAAASSACAEVFACVVGQRPSKAPLYLNDTAEVLSLLAKMGGVALPPRNSSF